LLIFLIVNFIISLLGSFARYSWLKSAIAELRLLPHPTIYSEMGFES